MTTTARHDQMHMQARDNLAPYVEQARAAIAAKGLHDGLGALYATLPQVMTPEMILSMFVTALSVLANPVDPNELPHV